MQQNPWKIVQSRKIMSWWRFHAGAEMLQDALCFYDTWVTCLRNWNYLDIAAHPKLLTNSSKAFGTTFWVVRWGTLAWAWSCTDAAAKPFFLSWHGHTLLSSSSKCNLTTQSKKSVEWSWELFFILNFKVLAILKGNTRVERSNSFF